MDEQNIPEGAIPIDQFEPQAPMQQQPVQEGMPAGAIPIDQFESREDVYGSPGQQAITALEGAASGVVGPLAPLIETKLMGVKPEDILARRQENPFSYHVPEAATLVGGLLIGTGQGALMGKAGKVAAEAAGFSKVLEAEKLTHAAAKAAQIGLPEAGVLAAEAKAATEALSYGSKVGSEAAKQTAEMIVFASGDEVSKMLIQDPDASAESAISNIGLAAALGGAGGAFVTGAISPLWSATAGPQVEKFLSGLKSHVNGEGKLLLPGELEHAHKSLGIELSPTTRAAISGDPNAASIFNELREAQHPEIMRDIKNLHERASASVLESLRVAPEDIANYSENQAGQDLIASFKREYDAKFAPIQKQYDALREQNVHIAIPDEQRLRQYSAIIEKGQKFGASGSPQAKIFDEYGERLLAQDTIGQTDKLVTEINNELKKAHRAGDTNTAMAFKEIKASIQEFQEQQIMRVAKNADKMALDATRVPGMPRVNVGELDSAAPAAGQLITERAAAAKEYARIAKISDEMSQQMGLGEFRGYKNLLTKLAEKKSPEQVLKSLSPKGNADIIPFLAEHFPETLARIRDNETKQLIRPAILGAKGEEVINLKILNNAIEKGMAGSKERIEFALPPGALERIQSAHKLINALPAMKSSGTAGWQQKLNKFMPASAGAAMSILLGQNPMAGYAAGHLSQILGKNAPEAVKLALLKFLASDQPIKSEGFKALVDFIQATQKGENLIAKATANVFKPGIRVLTDNQIPAKADLIKLDKLVADNQDHPEKFMASQNGQVGHYASEAQASLSKASATALQYLQNLKPHPKALGPLDKPLPVSPAEEARYNRALEIAQQPATVLQRIKDGTLQTTDLVDLKSMYPAVYIRMAQKLTNEMISMKSDEEVIPYRTRIAVSLFLGQPLDASMIPSSILAAQPQPKPQMPPQGQQPKPKSLNSLGKSNKSYQTPGQSSEQRRADHD